MLLKATTVLLGAAAVAQGFVLPLRQGSTSSAMRLAKQHAARTLKPAELFPARCVRHTLASACVSVHTKNASPHQAARSSPAGPPYTTTGP